MSMDYQEGYNDGLAGAGMQERDKHPHSIPAYLSGFIDGSLDRKVMLAQQEEVLP